MKTAGIMAGILAAIVTYGVVVRYPVPEMLSPAKSAPAPVQIAEPWQPVDATMTCHDDVRSRAQYPSKADFYSLAFRSFPLAGVPGSWIIAGKVDLMNGFGAMIPHLYHCVWEDRVLIEVTVRPEGG
jgi:hypothetical protein